MILIDMFEVQLGAAVLLRFNLDSGEPVTILADAGTHGRDYDNDYIKLKVRKTLGLKGDDKLHINLLIGTHYDADHLNRMKAIIEDPNTSIDEAWMPPVVDDTMPTAEGTLFGDEELLPLKFAGSCDTQNDFKRYITVQANEINYINEPDKSVNNPITKEENKSSNRDAAPNIKFFQEQLKHTSELLGTDVCCHAELVDDEELDEQESGLSSFFLDPKVHSPSTQQRIAWLKRSAASRAINANALNEVITELKNKGVPIRSRYIQAGSPRRFVWDAKTKRFVGVGKDNDPGELEFVLLGPSKALIEKHQQKLPTPDRYKLALLTHIPIKSITPSNQLSYVLHFRSKGQGILITGDTGCVDFKPKGQGSYYESLLNEMTPLNVVQISHHGGANAHFYRVLLQCAGSNNLRSSFMLLSHETESKHRPSDTFAKFIEEVRTLSDGPSLLLTNTPESAKVTDYKEFINDYVGAAKKKGDVSLKFDGDVWKVTKHPIDRNNLQDPDAPLPKPLSAGVKAKR